MKLEFSRQSLENHRNIKYENPLSGSRVVPCGLTDRQTITKIILAFSQFRERA